ncbi:MAG TPA: hypothetical protein DHW82_04885 [Spirochaetia bacterium]|nr:MAG: hypothetical protein A2Y41_12675 [Spirochaetes bacterium GWB1_36_13]HCL56328.1 hypothetical protein [Spirochaetia bacterium]
MKVLILIIKKFLSSAKDKKYISKMSFFSYILVALSIAVPILVLSVTNGFQGIVKENIFDYEYHFQVFFPELINFENIQDFEGVRSVGFYEDKCLIKSRTSTAITQLRGFRKEDYEKYKLQEPFLSIVKNNFTQSSKIEEDRRYPKKDGIVLAENLAINLGVGLGDKINLIAIDHSVGYNHFSQKEFEVTGIVSLGYAAFDTTASFILKEDMNDLFVISENTINKIALKLTQKTLKKGFSGWEKKITDSYPQGIFYSTIDNKIFRDFEEEKKSLAAAMFFIMIIAFIAIFITLNVVLADKRIDIVLLKTLGMNNYKILNVFLGQGIFIAIIGSLAGFFLSTLVLINLDDIIVVIEKIVNGILVYSNLIGITENPPWYQWKMMPEEVFYVSSLPYRLEMKDFFIQGLGAFAFALAASFSPAVKVFKANPAEILRNE